MTRQDFLRGAAGAVMASGVQPAAVAAAQRRGPRRGVSLFSYSADINLTVDLEGCLAEIDDLGTEGQEMGVEILTSVIENYPNPSDAWVKKWHNMCARYHLRPVEYGHWVESKLYAEGPEGLLGSKESYNQLVQDIRLANRLGFTCGRTKIGVIDADLYPVPNWKEFIKPAIEVAAKNNFRMLTEVHAPTLLKSRVLDTYMEFIIKEKCTPWFGLNIDFGVFMNRPESDGEWARGQTPGVFSKPEDIIPFLPYTHCCHAKFYEVSENCEDMTIPYPAIIKILVDHNWNNYILSEYEGKGKATGEAFAAVRRHHVMLKRLLGET